MGGSKGGGGEAAAARADEQARQATIRDGTKRINDIFFGGTNTVQNRVAVDPSQAYRPAGDTGGTATDFKFDSDNHPIERTFEDTQPFGSFASPRPDPTGRAVDPNARRLMDGVQNDGSGYFRTETSETTTPGQFNDEFFDQRRQAFMDYATPQLDQQRSEAERELSFALARQGLTNSSVRGQKGGDLQRLFDTNQQQVADQALAYETESRNSVENARNDLIQMLQVTGDAEGAANSALARSSILSRPQAFSPLGNLFNDFTSGLGTQLAMERSAAMGLGPAPTRSTGLFGPSRNAVTVRG